MCPHFSGKEQAAADHDFAKPLSFNYNLCQVQGENRSLMEDKEVADHTGTEKGGLVGMTADVVAAYVAQNTLPSTELPSLIQRITPRSSRSPAALSKSLISP